MAGEEQEQEYEDFEDDDTLSMDFQYAEVVVQYGRVYQRYALEEELYYVPADPVCLSKSYPSPIAWKSYAQSLEQLVTAHTRSLIVLAGRRRTIDYPASCCHKIS